MERHLRDAQVQLQEKEVELLNCKILMRDMENDLKDAQGQLQEKEELEENSNRNCTRWRGIWETHKDSYKDSWAWYNLLYKQLSQMFLLKTKE